MSKPITISIVGNAGPLKKSLREADDAMKRFGDGLKKFGMAAAAGMGAVAAGIGLAAKAAAEDQKSFALMENALRNVTGATHEQIRAIDQQIAKMSLATGVADDKLRPAFAALTRGTRDLEESTNQFGLVLDIATALQMDATTVADALAKGYEGNTRALRTLSPEMAAVIKEGASMSEIMEILTANFEGASAAAADTFEGRMARLKVAFSEIVEQIGYALLPMLEKVAGFIADKVVPIVQEFADAFSEGGLGAAVDLGIGKLMNFYDEASSTTRAVITGTIALGGMLAAYKALVFIQTITTLVNGFTASINAATFSMGAFQTTALGMAKTLGAIFLSLAITIEGLMKDNAFAARKLLEGFAKLVNTTIAGLEVAAESANRVINGLIYAYNLINPFSDVPSLPTDVSLGRISEDFGSATAGLESPSRAGTSGPDFLERSLLRAATPTIVAPAIAVPAPIATPGGGGGGGGGGGRRRRGGGGGGEAVFSPMLGGLGGGIEQMSFDFSKVDTGDLFSLDRMSRMASGEMLPPVNITVNTVSADANLPNLIVEALQTYNLTSGPIDVQITA